MSKSMAELAKEVIESNGSCDPIAVVKTFHDAMTRMQELDGYFLKPENLCKHPIFHLWVNKLRNMCIGSSSMAMIFCQNLAEEVEIKIDIEDQIDRARQKGII